MNRDSFIKDLSEDLKKVSPPVDPHMSILAWATFSLSLALVMIFIFYSFREDLHQVRAQPWFILNLISLLITTLSSSYVGVVSSLPGRAKPKVATVGIYLGILLFHLTLIPSLSHTPFQLTLRSGINIFGLRCSCSLLFLGIIPGILLFIGIRRLAPIRPTLVGAMIGVAMGAVGAFGLGLDCMIPNAVHLAVYHGIPILLMGLIGAFFGKKLLKW